MVAVIDGTLVIFNIPMTMNQSLYHLEPVVKLDIGDPLVVLNLVRWMPFGSHDMIAVTDFLSNLFIFKDGKLFKCYISIHSRLITDLTWIFTFNETHPEEPVPALVTCSMDGSFKIWSLTDQQTPIYEQSSSKKWVYQAAWDSSTNTIFFNTEGKFFPQKILSLQQNQVITRKFNFFSENILASRSSVGRDHIYSVGINGVVSRIPKKVSINSLQGNVGHMPRSGETEGKVEERNGGQGASG